MFNRFHKNQFREDEAVTPEQSGLSGFGAILPPAEEEIDEKKAKEKALLALLESLYGKPSQEFVSPVFDPNFENSCKIFNELFTYKQPEGKFKELVLDCTASDVSPLIVAKTYVKAEFEDKSPEQKARQAVELAFLAANNPALMNSKKGIELFGENPETTLFLFLAAEQLGFADKVLQGGYTPPELPQEHLEQMQAMVANEFKNMSAIARGYLAEPEAPAADEEPDSPPIEEPDTVPASAEEETSPEDAPAPSTPEETVNVDDYVQWTSGGVDQFEEPKRVEKISDDGSYLWVEGSNTGIPVNEVKKQEPPKAPVADVIPTKDAKPEPLVLTNPVMPSKADREANAEVKKSTSTLGRAVLEKMENEGAPIVTRESDIWRYWGTLEQSDKDALMAQSKESDKAARARIDAMLRPQVPETASKKPAPSHLENPVLPTNKALSPEFNEIVKDPRYKMAVEYAAEHGKISRDRLHNHIKSKGERIGSSTMTKIFNAMEENGLLSAPTSRGRKYIGPTNETPEDTRASYGPRKAVQHVLVPRTE